MSKLDVLPLSTGAYIADTQHLSLAQHGAYLLILMTMWRAGGWIDDDEKKLARIVKLSVPKWRKIAADIVALLIRKDGKLSQKRLLSETEKALKRVTQNRLNGELGGKAKSLKNKEQDLANANDSLESQKKPPLSTKPQTQNLFGESESGDKFKKNRLPRDWVLPPAWHLWARQQGASDEDIKQYASTFGPHWWSTGERRADWFATWQKWILNEQRWAKERKQRYSNGATNGKDRSVSAAAARLADEGFSLGPRPTGVHRETGGDNVRLLPKR